MSNASRTNTGSSSTGKNQEQSLGQTDSITSEPKAPSRSEIETALSGRTKVNSKTARPTPPTGEFDLNAPPRRQQVIGGNLSGVSNKPKLGIFSRYSNMSISNWVATFIVMLILLAFFWPNNKKSTLETTAPNLATQGRLGETDLSIDEQKEILESEASDPELSFSRDTDLDRAGEYRSQDAQDLQIRALLDQAKQYISKGELIKPVDANALLSYEAILAISPRNSAAREGIDYLKSRFMSAGYSALEKDKLTVAESVLAGLNKIDAQSDEAAEFATAIDTWKTNKAIDELFSKASAATKKNALILPARSNALYFYQQVLDIEPKNGKALLGIKKIADTFVGKANNAVIEGDFQAASAHLATVSVIDSTHDSIPLIEALITRAKPLAEKAQEVQDQEVEEETDSVAASEPSISTIDTPKPATKPVSAQTNEQQTFDRQYLKQGLEAYYQGEYGIAAALLQPLADKGIARAQFRLAYMYFLGRGFEKNRKTADTMIRAALPAIQRFANDGRAWAQSDLASLYEDGLVLPRDYNDAFKWYELAANQGYPGAQTNLGMMYARGRGVEASRKTAIEWFQRAAKQGDNVAKRNLDALGVTP